ncbi:MAG: cyclic nucleotide-binding domain-containing protein [Minwuia sp.]|uniref:cyclic nucleotide-binding domain-containing protein n=1 Tax=Minwuia sp. TaxID=2493630 RepID=UPI003A849881
MSLNEEVDLLRQIPMFQKVEQSKLKLLAFTSERLVFQPDQTVCEQGEPGDSMYVIVDGAADVIVNLPNGPLTVATLKKNSFFGEIAILCDVPRTATVKATSKLTTLRITKDLFYRLVSEFPQMTIEIMREIAARLDRTTQDLQSTRNELTELRKSSGG